MTTYCISGSRGITDGDWVVDLLEELFQRDAPAETRIIVGDAKGVDAIIAAFYDCEVFKADWDRYGSAAGPLRNEEMVEQADVVVAFWDGKSRGTRDAIIRAISMGKELHVYVYGVS